MFSSVSEDCCKITMNQQSTMEQQLMGGYSERPKPADAEVQELCDQVRPELEQKVGADFLEYVAVIYKTQVVAGTNYLVKINLGHGVCVHAVIFQPLQSDQVNKGASLGVYDYPKTMEDPLEVPTVSKGILGGWSKPMPADPKVQDLCNEVRSELEQKLGVNFLEYVAVIYKTQVVAGTNYVVKVSLGHPVYVHVEIFQPLPSDQVNKGASLSDYDYPKTREDPLVGTSTIHAFQPIITSGAWSRPKLADPMVQDLCNEVRAELEQKVGADFLEYVAVIYRTQVVAGTNYHVKINLGYGVCAHAVIFQPLQSDQVSKGASLSDYDYPKRMVDPLVGAFPMKPRMGGWSKPRLAHSNDQDLCDEVRGELEQKVGIDFLEYIAVLCKTAVVAGTNYLVKINLGHGVYVHAEIFQPLPSDPANKGASLSDYDYPKTREDPLVMRSKINVLPPLMPLPPIVGAWSHPKLAGPTVQDLCNGVRSELELYVGVDFLEYVAVIYKTQVVAGTNYLAKIKLGHGVYMHVMIAQPLPSDPNNTNPFLTNYDYPKTRADPLVVIEDKSASFAIAVMPWSDPKLANPAVQDLCNQVRPELEQKVGVNFQEYVAVIYRAQVTQQAGAVTIMSLNNLVKIRVGDGTYIHLEVPMVPFSKEPLHPNYEYPKTLDDPLVDFA